MNALARPQQGEARPEKGTASMVDDSGVVTVYPSPAGEVLSEACELTVAGRRVPVHACRVSAIPFNQVWPGYQRPLEQTELAAYASWDASGQADVQVLWHRPVQSVAVRPASRGIVPLVDGQRIRFRLPGPGPVVVEVNGWHHALHLFAAPPAPDPPGPDGPGVRFFGPGVHDVGQLTLGSGETLYLAGGAVVYGSVHAHGATDLRIVGRGVLDSSKQPRSRGSGSIRLTECQNVTIDGVTLRDPPAWCLSLFGGTGVRIANVKLIGLWRYNADGIDICNSQDVVVRDSFIRSFDDSIALKGMPGHADRPVRNVVVERCVIWNDWGRALEIGAETCAPEIASVVFRDIDIVRTSWIAMDIQHGDNATVHDVTFEDIDFEVDEVNLRPLIQQGPDHQFEPDPGFCPRLLVIEIRPTGWTQGTERGRVREVVFRAIRVRGVPRPASHLVGFDRAHDVSGVRLEDLSFNGRRVRTLAEAGVQIGPHVAGVVLQ